MKGLAEEIASHEGVSFVVDEATESDWYRCSCGGTFGRREWPPRSGKRVERVPLLVGPSKAEHIAESVAAWLEAGRSSQ